MEHQHVSIAVKIAGAKMNHEMYTKLRIEEEGDRALRKFYNEQRPFDDDTLNKVRTVATDLLIYFQRTAMTSNSRVRSVECRFDDLLTVNYVFNCGREDVRGSFTSHRNDQPVMETETDDLSDFDRAMQGVK